MKTLKESILDDMEDVLNNGDKCFKDLIKEFLKANYNRASKFKISRKPNADGLYEVTYPAVLMKSVSLA